VGGKLWIETPYFEGKRHGLHQKWTADGKPEEQNWYFRGKKHGPSIFFGGRSPQIPFLHDGKPRQWFFVNGEEVSEATYIAISRTNATLPKISRSENEVKPRSPTNPNTAR
jgi:hypothetical protein